MLQLSSIVGTCISLFPYTLLVGHVVKHWDFFQYDRWEIVSQCSFNLHFSYYEWGRDLLKVLKDHLRFILVTNSASGWEGWAVTVWERLILLPQMSLRLLGHTTCSFIVSVRGSCLILWILSTPLLDFRGLLLSSPTRKIISHQKCVVKRLRDQWMKRECLWLN